MAENLHEKKIKTTKTGNNPVPVWNRKKFKNVRSKPKL
jgi:hypothetical protein